MSVLGHSTLESGKDFYVQDRWRREYHFKIASFPVPTGIASEAVEVKEEPYSGYVIKVLSDWDADIEGAEETLKKIIRKKINKRQIKRKDDQWEIDAYRTVEGRIESNLNPTRSEYDRLFVIDGKEITIEEFINMLEPYEGWSFQFRIIDSYESNLRRWRPITK